MKVVTPPRYQTLDLERIALRFKGNPKYVREMCVRGSPRPVAVFQLDPDPGQERGDFLLLWKDLVSNMLTTGRMSWSEMERECLTPAAHCQRCGDVIYSSGKHISVWCSCRTTIVEGGRDSFRWSGRYDTNVVMLNLLTGRIVREGLPIPSMERT